LEIHYNVSVKDRYDFIIVTGQVLIDIQNDVILTISISSDLCTNDGLTNTNKLMTKLRNEQQLSIGPGLKRGVHG
jgi:hypothetical protein